MIEVRSAQPRLALMRALTSKPSLSRKGLAFRPTPATAAMAGEMPQPVMRQAVSLG
ncbi:hypothetical protein D3C85_1747790 [compost metagenome]